jgi:hypothetical protein
MKESVRLLAISDQLSVRFVVVASLLRGALDRPEVLDDANQWRAFSSWRQGESREVRTDFELRYDEARVVWARDGKKPSRYVDPKTRIAGAA